MAKKYTLTEEQFIMLTSNAIRLRNYYCAKMRKAKMQGHEDVVVIFYQREIDEINETFDSLNAKFKTNF
jgi:hypothetical protein